MWRPYGSVMRFEGEIMLISEDGDIHEQSLAEPAREVAVETYFGPGGAEFRVASPHVFDLVVAAPSTDGSHVRFRA